MPPRWLTIEKLVVELGGVCTSHYELRSGAETEAVADEDAKDAVGRATSAVGAVLSDHPREDDDEVVRTAWHAIAQAQDVIGRLRETVQHARALRDRGQRLQDESLRLRGATSNEYHPGWRRTDRG